MILDGYSYFIDDWKVYWGKVVLFCSVADLICAEILGWCVKCEHGVYFIDKVVNFVDKVVIFVDKVPEFIDIVREFVDIMFEATF
ncbi:hypothetical protein CN692_11980 [Bacillus sp. AFS002410]|uniref:hypothetical protein n=1 Tax=Bacillus sp. AFS002410 TaxID=2033481 RepID=UPI000BF04E27|nr:hypothetical protein [Bacillus sp. AFS002410]PEJ57799.1 hypothetical protein CN692_11980 [Bacillus sp. AFS002410]